MGDYTHKVMDMHSQKYNPEVPTLQSDIENNHSRLHKINDQLITMKNIVNKQVSFRCLFSADFILPHHIYNDFLYLNDDGDGMHES